MERGSVFLTAEGAESRRGSQRKSTDYLLSSGGFLLNEEQVSDRKNVSLRTLRISAPSAVKVSLSLANADLV
jgi:hypothetical protein